MTDASRSWGVNLNLQLPVSAGVSATYSVSFIHDAATNTDKYGVTFGGSFQTSKISYDAGVSASLLNEGVSSQSMENWGVSGGGSAKALGLGANALISPSDHTIYGYEFSSSTSNNLSVGVSFTNHYDISDYVQTDPKLYSFYQQVNAIMNGIDSSRPDLPLQLNVAIRSIQVLAATDIVDNPQVARMLLHTNTDGVPYNVRNTNNDGGYITAYTDSTGKLLYTENYDSQNNLLMRSFLDPDGTRVDYFDKDGHRIKSAFSALDNSKTTTTTYNADGSVSGQTTVGSSGAQRVEIHDTPTYYEEFRFDGAHLTTSITWDKVSDGHSYTYDGLDGTKIKHTWSPTFDEYREDAAGGAHVYRKSDSSGNKYVALTQDGSLQRYVDSVLGGTHETTSVTAGGAKSYSLSYASGSHIEETSQITRVTSGTSYSDREVKLTHRETNASGTLILDQSWWPSNGYQKHYFSLDSAGTRTTQDTTETGITWHSDVIKANGDYSLRTLDLGGLRGHTDVKSSGTSGVHDVQDFVITAQGSQAQMLERRLDTNAGSHSHVVYQPDGKMVLNEQSDDVRHTSTVERYWANGKMQSQDIVNADKSESHRTWGEDSRPLKDLELRSDGSKTYTEWYAGTFQTKLADAYDKSGQLIQHTTYWENGRYQEQDTVNADHSASYTSFDQNSFITKQILVKADGSETVKTNFASSNTAQTVDTFDPAGNPVSHTVNNASGQWTVQDSFAPNSHDLVSHQVRDPSTNNGQTYFFDNGEVHREMLTYAGTNQFVFDVTPQDGKLLINGPIAPSSFNTLYQFERGHLDAFDGLIDGRINVAPGLSVGIDNPNIANAITARVAALDAGTGGAFHDQHLADTQALVSDYLKASLAHDYHL